MWRKLKIEAAILFISVMTTQTAFSKTVKIAWEAIPDAIRYEIKIERNLKPVFNEEVTGTAWQGGLNSGIYLYQFRAVDELNRPGEWSVQKSLIVTPDSPELLDPGEDAEVRIYYSRATVLLKWKPVISANQYEIEIREKGRLIVSKITREPQFKFIPGHSGEYFWSVRSVLENSNKEPAAVKSKNWKGKPSESARLVVKKETLDSPMIIEPRGKSPPPEGGHLKLTWKSVKGADGYELSMAFSGEGGRKIKTKETSAIVEGVREGIGSWKVRALASYERSDFDSKGPISEAQVEFDRNYIQTEGSGYVALSSLISPYDYHFSVPFPGVEDGSASSTAATLRLSGEYWFATRWGVSAMVEATFFQIQGQDFTRHSKELDGKYRVMFGDSKWDWVLFPKIGLEDRDYLVFRPDLKSTDSTDFTSFKFSAIGPSFGFDLRKQIADRFSLGLKASYFLPVTLTGAPPGVYLISDESYRNFSFGLQGFYWLASHWGLGLGGYVDLRSIGFYSPAMNPNEQSMGQHVSMDAAYLFGSLLYRF